MRTPKALLFLWLAAISLHAQLAQRVKDLNTSTSAAHGFINYPTAVGPVVYFTGSPGRLWRTDGTTSGTYVVADVNRPNSYAALGSTLIFQAYHPDTGYELWKSDGTTAGTTPIKDIDPGQDSGCPFKFVNVGSHLYFSASNGTQGSELWRTDGT